MTSAFPAPSATSPAYRAALRGALLGGATGDALGYPVEMLSRTEMFERYKVKNSLELLDTLAAQPLVVSDDTQLTLYTLDGLSEVLEWNNDGQAADELACIWLAYLRWYRSTGNSYPAAAPFALTRPLDAQPSMSVARGPGKATLAALAAGEMQFISKNVNPQALGTGALIRSAPFGFLPVADDATVIKLSAHAAALTHGHPDAILSASAYALLVRHLLGSHEASDLHMPARQALEAVLQWLGTVEQSQALPGDAALTIAALQTALRSVDSGMPLERTLESFGDLWLAPGCLGFAAYQLLSAEQEISDGDSSPALATRKALAQAVSCDGDSDSIAALTGTLLGALYTEDVFNTQTLASLDAVPALELVLENWLKQLGVS
ncbi:Probable ADP-ribosylglycohydrolase [Mycobacteroides abscessus subsp. bolletii]|nr:Probable ADP-ribosylglycohydrolase [Mycobacteroides abscessus subsp. bolletii]